MVRLAPLVRPGHHDLPAPLDDLIGRAEAIAPLAQALRVRSPRLLVLTGPGGVGKTRLALAAARAAAASFADGVIFVSLAPIRDPALLAAAIAQAAGIRALGEVPLADRLPQFLAERDLLLVLDNFEHILAAAGLVSELLAACPRLTALVTSRARLRLTGESVVLVPPLSVPPRATDPVAVEPESVRRDRGPRPVTAFDLPPLDSASQSAAVQLFVARARAVQPTWQLAADNVGTVAEICRRLDGLPLAIELAAAQSRLFTPPALLSRLDHRLPLWEAGARDQPARLQTMRQAIAWSYDLLTPADQAVFRCLAVFLGGFGLEAAETVCQASLGQIGDLVDQSMIQPLAATDEPRFSMLETIREFGLEQLAAANLKATTRDRHAAWYRDLAARLEPALYGDGDQIQALELLEFERANIRTAFSWLLATGESEAALRLVTQLIRFWFIRGYLSEATELMETALAAAPRAPAPLRAWGLLGLAMVTMAHHADTRAAAAIAAALPLVEDGRDLRGLGFARLCQAHYAFMHGDFAGAEALAVESERIALRIPNWWDVQVAQFARAKAELYAGNLDRAEEINRGLFESSQGQELFMTACVRHDRGTILALRGDRSGALAAFASALRDFQALGEMWNTPMSLDAAALVAVALGEMSSAVRLFGQADALRTRSAAPVLLPDRPGYDRALATARAALGKTAFAAAWEAGATAPLAEVIGAVTELAARAATEPAPVAGAKPVAETTPAAWLTLREGEVLRLLAEGRSDPQIGAALSISPRTVESHVRHILTKLGVPSRAAAAAHAVRHGLA